MRKPLHTGETALITGASSGIGLEFAKHCAAGGADVILVARSKDKLEALADEIRETYGVSARVLAEDLSDPRAVERIVQAVDKTATPITMLINNAGVGTFGPFVNSDERDQRGMLELNVVSLTMLARALLPGMLQRKHGRILNVASIAAFQPGPLMSVYYATKAYVVNFSLALSDETKGTGVTVTCLCPGVTATNFGRHGGVEKSSLFSGRLADPASVMLAGYSGMIRGKPLVIPGVKNKLLALATRFIPRMTAAAVARMFQS